MIRPLSPIAILASLTFGCTDAPLSESVGLGFDGAGDVIEGEFIVRQQLSVAEMSALGLEELRWNEVLQAGLYRSTQGDLSLSELKRALSQDSRGATVSAENNRPRSAASIDVDDPYRSLQWNMDMLNIEAAWEHATGAGITIAVLDTGVATGGEDTPVNYVAGYDFIGDDWDPTDENEHGTHVAGTIAQATGNGRGVVGVAPEATVMGVRVLDARGGGSAYGIAEGIQWAADNGAQVINLSLGSAYSTGVEQDAIDHALSMGAVVVAASGNEYRNSVGYPAAYSDVIAVGAVQYDGSVAPYSNGGSQLDVVAPGGNTGVDQNGDGYADGVLQETLSGESMAYRFFDGTSMATPHVAGIAGLLLERGAAPGEVEEILASTAIDLEGAGHSTRSGWGLVDVMAALEAVDGSSSPPPEEDPVDEEPPAEDDAEEEPVDSTPPVILDVDGERSGDTLELRWSTDEPATTELEFEEYGWFGDTELVIEHEMRFTIDPGETYYFTVVATDAAGNTSEDGLWVTGP